MGWLVILSLFGRSEAASAMNSFAPPADLSPSERWINDRLDSSCLSYFIRGIKRVSSGSQTQRTFTSGVLRWQLRSGSFYLYFSSRSRMSRSPFHKRSGTLHGSGAAESIPVSIRRGSMLDLMPLRSGAIALR